MRLSVEEQTRVRLCTPCKIRLALLRGSPTGRAKSLMPLMPSSSSSSLSSVAPLEGDSSRKDDGEGGGGWRWGGAPSPMAPFGAPGAPHGSHARISSAAPHAPRRVYGGDCGGGGGVRGCGCAVVGGGDSRRREEDGPAAANRWAEGAGTTPPPLTAANAVPPRCAYDQLIPQPLQDPPQSAELRRQEPRQSSSRRRWRQRRCESVGVRRSGLEVRGGRGGWRPGEWTGGESGSGGLSPAALPPPCSNWHWRWWWRWL
jgi:hypothetical protein